MFCTQHLLAPFLKRVLYGHLGCSRYGAQWTRDFQYTVSGAAGLMDEASTTCSGVSYCSMNQRHRALTVRVACPIYYSYTYDTEPLQYCIPTTQSPAVASWLLYSSYSVHDSLP